MKHTTKKRTVSASYCPFCGAKDTGEVCACADAPSPFDEPIDPDQFLKFTPEGVSHESR